MLNVSAFINFSSTNVVEVRDIVIGFSNLFSDGWIGFGSITSAPSLPSGPVQPYQHLRLLRQVQPIRVRLRSAVTNHSSAY